MQPQLPLEGEAFAAATRSFDSLRTWIADDAQAQAGHALVERHVLTEVREIGRLIIQAHMDLRALRERQLPPPEAASEGAKPRRLARNLDTILGTVRVQRVAWQARQRVTAIPLDRDLDLPRELYSYGVQRFVAEQAETMSFGRTGLALRAMGVEVPRRQREQIVLRKPSGKYVIAVGRGRSHLRERAGLTRRRCCSPRRPSQRPPAGPASRPTPTA